MDLLETNAYFTFNYRIWIYSLDNSGQEGRMTEKFVIRYKVMARTNGIHFFALRQWSYYVDGI